MKGTKMSNGGNGVCKMFSSTSPHFFKVVVAETLRDRNILIPEKFVSKLETSLQSPVIFRLPGGLEWKVELTSSNDRVWFQKGWPEFADHVSLRRGHLLLFRYEGNSHFHVVVFDTSATEIDYPTNNLISTHLHNSKTKTNEVEDDIDSVEISDDDLASPFLKTENISPLQSLRPRKRMRTTSCSGPKPKPLSASERARALKRARSFKSENPFFCVVMEPSYISLSNVHVPKKFAERYISKKEADFTLRVLDGRSWFVRYRIRRRYGTSDSPEMLNPGWRTFAKDNHLKVGDVCIFELISNFGNNISVFQVSIDRNANHPSLEKSTTGPSAKVTERPPSPKEAFASFETKSNRSPSFQVLVQEYHLKHSILHVPSSFASSNFEKSKKQNVKLMVENRWWDVMVICSSYPKNRMLSKGWRKFARDNCLHPGDVCRFQMMHRSPLQLQVFIERAST